MNIPPLTIPADEYHATARRGEYMFNHLLGNFRMAFDEQYLVADGEVVFHLGKSHLGTELYADFPFVRSLKMVMPGKLGIILHNRDRLFKYYLLFENLPK